jgi:hypothetical protein
MASVPTSKTHKIPQGYEIVSDSKNAVIWAVEGLKVSGKIQPHWTISDVTYSRKSRLWSVIIDTTGKA